jgi:hypothetical protein
MPLPDVSCVCRWIGSSVVSRRPRDQDARGLWPQQARHVLHADDVGPHVLDAAHEVHVVFDAILRARGVVDVARVAHSDLGDLAGAQHTRDRHGHRIDVVEAVEHAEHVDARERRLVDEGLDDVLRVARVADRVGAAQQHLVQHVRDRALELLQAIPWVLVQEAIRDVERRAAPGLEREQRVAQERRRGRDRHHVPRAHARREQRLVRIAHRRVGQERPLLSLDPLDDLAGSTLGEDLRRAGRRRLRGHGRHRRRCTLGRLQPLVAPHRGMAVHDDVREIRQQLRRAVLAARDLEQLRRVVEEPCPRLAAHEGLVLEHVLQEREVRLDAADAELAQRAPSLLGRVLERRAVGDALDEQRVVVARNDRAGQAVAAVEPQPEPARSAVGHDRARVRQEVVLRVLGRDAALDREAARLHVVLRPDADLGAREVEALLDADLRLHEIDARDLLGHRVLDLQPGVDLDEVVLVAGDQELERARVVVTPRARECQRIREQRAPHRLGQIRRRRDLDDLLVPPLHRAVALVQVHEVAGQVAEDLHLDVSHARQELLEEDHRTAERGQRLAAGLAQQRRQLLQLVDDAHAAAAAAVRGP